MKQYDHEPTMTELFDQLAAEDAFLPEFIPAIRIPIAGKIISKMIKKGLVNTLADTMLS